jgi:putative ATPase
MVHQSRPLADRMRPTTLDEFVGQEHLVGKGKVFERVLDQDTLPSMILWGPPGSGKTTLAHIIAHTTKAKYIELSATSSGVKDIREVVTSATGLFGSIRAPILFIDEIHRFNKSQQDTLLPFVEDGTIVLIGATTENPSFEVNSALLSRSRVFVLNALDAEDIEIVIKRAIVDRERGLGSLSIKISDETIHYLATIANGDARVALNALELAVSLGKKSGKHISIDNEHIEEALQKSHLLYDRAGEEHYNIISALHKSMRGGDADASLYWLGRMLEAGEDPLYVARRLIRFSSEDIGIANSLALPQAIAAYEAAHYIGMPECAINLAQAVVYMAKSKKSNVLYTAYQAVQADIKNIPNEPVPIHLRNAPTKLMKNFGYGKGYKYTPDFKNEEEAQQDYLPKKLKGKKYLVD